MKRLGVGIVYLPGLEPVLQSGRDLIDVIEVEPATIWYKKADGSFKSNGEILSFLADQPFHKLIHGVGFPIGGSVPPEAASFAPFQHIAELLQPEFISEHLNFNKAMIGRTVVETGFLLPALQSLSTVKQVVNNINGFKQHVNYPFAFETPVNYLQPMSGEISDGDFFALIAEQSNCGILLDLHNLWCNEINGRQRILDVIDCLPLDRIWEVHIAGGDWLNGYWLDGHSGLIPDPLKEIAADVIPRLTELKAFNFEILPEHFESKKLSVNSVLSELQSMKEIWNLPKKDFARLKPKQGKIPDASIKLTPAQWETQLSESIRGNIQGDLAKDNGVQIYQQLVEKARSGMFASTLTLTFRYMFLTIGEEETMNIIRKFWEKTPPSLFSSEEASNLVNYLKEQELDIDFLEDVMNYEIANHRALINGETQTVNIGFDPNSFFPMLDQGQLPKDIQTGTFQINITV